MSTHIPTPPQALCPGPPKSARQSPPLPDPSLRFTGKVLLMEATRQTVLRTVHVHSGPLHLRTLPHATFGRSLRGVVTQLLPKGQLCAPLASICVILMVKVCESSPLV